MTRIPDLQPESRPLGGRYRLLQPLGAGGFGQTFQAQDLHLPGHPLCVVKQLQPQVSSIEELQVARRLFDTEAQVLYRLGSHPQIPGLLAHFEEDQEFYLAQEYIQGHSLAEELQPGAPWSEAQVVSFLGDLLGILAFVHGAGVIHRDIKPNNLIRRASDNRLVLIDFGAVKQVSAQATTRQSHLSHTISIGTQGYMPSEQLAGRPQFSSDIYAVGVLGIQALTGCAPTQFQPDPCSGELDWQRYASNTHPALLAVLEQMVRYDFRTRYANASEALAALGALPRGLSQYIPPPMDAPGRAVAPSPRATQANPTVAVSRQPALTQASIAPATGRPQRSALLWLWPVVAIAAMALGGLLSWRSLAPTPTADNQPVPPTPPTGEEEANAPIQPPVADATDSDPEEEDPSPVDDPRPTAPLASAPPSPEPDTNAEPPASPEAELTPEAAQATVSTLYSYISSQAWDSAQAQFSGPLAQQFDPGFFTQFEQVTVENLRVTGQSADTIELIGENTYVYPD
ncbi:MAG: protein kinase, partial [Leptolyngbyaceae cyanobacterium SM2_5_2]|nr:protein kinase [Leptolyngbyaceae cyanobacterium SM2_5_2]